MFFFWLKALLWLLVLSVLLFSHLLIFCYYYCLFCVFSACLDLLLLPIFIVVVIIITNIAPIIIGINFFSLFVVLFFYLFYFVFSFYFWLNNYYFHMKRLRLVNCFACLFVLFLELKSYDKNSQPHCFSPVSKEFANLTDFMVVIVKYNIFIAPSLGFFLANLISSGFELCWERIPVCFETFCSLLCSHFYVHVIYQLNSPEAYSLSSKTWNFIVL